MSTDDLSVVFNVEPESGLKFRSGIEPCFRVRMTSVRPLRLEFDAVDANAR